jgi:hypothetical protein
MHRDTLTHTKHDNMKLFTCFSGSSVNEEKLISPSMSVRLSIFFRRQAIRITMVIIPQQWEPRSNYLNTLLRNSDN